MFGKLDFITYYDYSNFKTFYFKILPVLPNEKLLL